MTSPITKNGGHVVSALLIAWAVVCVAGSYAADAKHSNRLLVKFRNAYDAQVQNVVNSLGARITSEIPAIGVKVVEFPHGTNVDAKLRALQNHAKVAFAELDEAVPPAAIPNDPFYNREWHLVRIGAPGAWNIATGSTDLIIAILDTGMDGTQPDLAPKMVPGWNFYDNNGDTSDLYSSHGTGVAGAAAATSNNNAGVAAPAWNCKLMPCRITDPNNIALASTAANALIWAADHGARVANISFQFTASSTVSAAAQYFQSHGGVVTMSAGNNGAFNPLTDNPYILSISATDANDVLASWSNTGNYIDLAAPGVNIYTTVKGGGYGPGSGTSYSAPIVAGVAALVLSVNPALSGQQVRDILFDSAMDLGAAGWDPKYGWGRIDAFAAVQLASGNPPPNDVLPPDITSVDPPNGTTVSGLTTVQVTATDNVAIASVSFSVDGILQATDTTAPYDFSWNTFNVSNGTHTILISATDTSANTAQVSISVTVSNLADTTPPTIAITSPNNGATVSGLTTVQVTATDNVAIASVSFSVDGILQATDTTAPYDFNWNTLNVSNGTHSILISATDTSANTAQASISVTVSNLPDTTPPTVAITSPNNGATVSGLTTVQVTATDNIAIASVSFSVDGILQATDTTAPYDFSWDTSNVSNGTHAILISATDTSANTAQASISVTVSNLDTTPPTVAITSPNNGATVSGMTTVQVTATDNVAIASVSLSVDGIIQATDTMAPYDFNWDTSNVSNGTHAILISATDTSANTAQASISVTVSNLDTTPPTVAITSPNNGATVSGMTTVQVTAVDNVAIASVSFSVDGILQATDTTAPYDFTWNTLNVSNGTHAILISATDTSANTAQASISVTVSNIPDTTPPTIAITSPNNGAKVQGNVSVSFAVGDDVGVVRVELYVDGVLTKTSTAAPFTIKWSASTVVRGAHTLKARAFDLAGNSAWSASITVNR